MAKETLGYQSRTAAVLAFRKEGLSAERIAERIGIDVKTVSALECSARRWREKAPNFVRPSAGSFPIGVRERLRPHARARDISVDTLIRRLVETVAFGNLVDAVLDDAEELGP
ncbi:MAG: hypothetical protein E5V22_31835 [Mesorhizobium sp.]|uniref:hypothetical protein n=1 Tax=Mesorhizobium sp. TaxID=1871066 RepID=UPI000FE6EC79|nr:hypothetical protein [Mesorhizobium sp.]RWE55181.1 MAG: hypothetical protein EOS24_23795 [Mesorhizobium sp.]TIX97615.1 MAG: hypothetical protein E5V22_31835 [Mesorhizobium sp.]